MDLSWTIFDSFGLGESSSLHVRQVGVLDFEGGAPGVSYAGK